MMMRYVGHTRPAAGFDLLPHPSRSTRQAGLRRSRLQPDAQGSRRRALQSESSWRNGNRSQDLDRTRAMLVPPRQNPRLGFGVTRGCFNFARIANSATRTCRRIRLRPGSALLNAPSALPARKGCCMASARTVAANSSPDPGDPPLCWRSSHHRRNAFENLVPDGRSLFVAPMPHGFSK
jgi:hypothetical protein